MANLDRGLVGHLSTSDFPLLGYNIGFEGRRKWPSAIGKVIIVAALPQLLWTKQVI